MKMTMVTDIENPVKPVAQKNDASQKQTRKKLRKIGLCLATLLFGALLVTALWRGTGHGVYSRRRLGEVAGLLQGYTRQLKHLEDECSTKYGLYSLADPINVSKLGEAETIKQMIQRQYSCPDLDEATYKVAFAKRNLNRVKQAKLKLEAVASQTKDPEQFQKRCDAVIANLKRNLKNDTDAQEEAEDSDPNGTADEFEPSEDVSGSNAVLALGNKALETQMSSFAWKMRLLKRLGSLDKLEDMIHSMAKDDKGQSQAEATPSKPEETEATETSGSYLNEMISEFVSYLKLKRDGLTAKEAASTKENQHWVQQNTECDETARKLMLWLQDQEKTLNKKLLDKKLSRQDFVANLGNYKEVYAARMGEHESKMKESRGKAEIAGKNAKQAAEAKRDLIELIKSARQEEASNSPQKDLKDVKPYYDLLRAEFERIQLNVQGLGL